MVVNSRLKSINAAFDAMKWETGGVVGVLWAKVIFWEIKWAR
jgi:hypothetical protein